MTHETWVQKYELAEQLQQRSSMHDEALWAAIWRKKAEDYYEHARISVLYALRATM